MKIDCAILETVTNVQISSAVTAQMICVFVFDYVKSRFSHGTALLTMSSQYSLDDGAFPCLRASRLISKSFRERALFASLLAITARKI